MGTLKDTSAAPRQGFASYFQYLVAYNHWANDTLYAACAQLTEDERQQPRAVYFGSIHKTLNHILVGDILWRTRFEGAPVTIPLEEVLHTDFETLRSARRVEDDALSAMVAGLDDTRIGGVLAYKTSTGHPSEAPIHIALGHLFNHQTHHRGQVHTCLSQTRVAPPSLDIMYFHRDQTGQLR